MFTNAHDRIKRSRFPAGGRGTLLRPSHLEKRPCSGRAGQTSCQANDGAQRSEAGTHFLGHYCQNSRRGRSAQRRCSTPRRRGGAGLCSPSGTFPRMQTYAPTDDVSGLPNETAFSCGRSSLELTHRSARPVPWREALKAASHCASVGDPPAATAELCRLQVVSQHHFASSGLRSSRRQRAAGYHVLLHSPEQFVHHDALAQEKFIGTPALAGFAEMARVCSDYPAAPFSPSTSDSTYAQGCCFAACNARANSSMLGYLPTGTERSASSSSPRSSSGCPSLKQMRAKMAVTITLSSADE